jgi:predicted RNA-binding Zn-ribbon protein involved in translation (DUF1610 family)
MRQYTHRVWRTIDVDGTLRHALVGEHTSKALAQKRVARYVSASNGKLTAQDFKVTFNCPLCGQHITDGKPCGCGAR